MKVAPLHWAFQRYGSEIRHFIVHTGQHYDPAMSKVFFDDLDLPKPDFFLGVGSDTHGRQTAKIMTEFETVVIRQRPDLIIVVGDVNSTLACSLVGVKLGIPVAHVEAGLRSGDRSMPEEINRIVTDSIADFLFVTEPSGVKNLQREGAAASKVFFVGNTMIDSLLHYRATIVQSKILERLSLRNKEYVLVTLHRPSNVDHAERLATMISIFEKISRSKTIVFPAHPRTMKMLSEFGLEERIRTIANVRVIEPAGYIDFMKLAMEASMIITDSGGIQEETTVLGIPCLTLRDSTERPITVDIGTNSLCALDEQAVLSAFNSVLSGTWKKGTVPDLWDGKAADRIVAVLTKRCFAM
jgi:UDP-N-acetylglucosamine 2-epimerase (non-hydrolysing)